MTSCGCTRALTRRGVSSASTPCLRFSLRVRRRGRLPQRVNRDADRGTRLGIGRPPPLRRFCRGFGSLVLPTTHTHDQRSNQGCAGGRQHKRAKQGRGAAGAQGETRRRDKWKKNDNKIKDTGDEKQQNSENNSNNNTQRWDRSDRERNGTGGEQTRCGAAVAKTATARGPQDETNEHRHGRQNGRKAGVGEARSASERDCDGAVTAALLRGLARGLSAPRSVVSRHLCMTHDFGSAQEAAR
jgi:hypothetical protein